MNRSLRLSFLLFPSRSSTVQYEEQREREREREMVRGAVLVMSSSFPLFPHTLSLCSLSLDSCLVLSLPLSTWKNQVAS